MENSGNHHHQQNAKKSTNQYKALYKISKEKRTKAMQMDNSEAQSKKVIKKQVQINNYGNPYVLQEDSLDIQDGKYIVCDKKQVKNEVHENIKGMSKSKNSHQRMQSGSSQPKKRTHNRSHSCPFIAPLQSSLSMSNRAQKSKAVPYKKQHQGQSRRTLKKKSANFYLKHQKHPNNNLHNKNRQHPHKCGHKNQNSHFSQQSNTIIVHTLPIEQLSSMLYSSNNNNNKKDHTDTASQPILARQMFSIHNDLYFQTRLQQQIKMYNLNQQMQALQKQTQNVRIKQDVLEKLANQFEMHRLREQCEEEDQDCDDSLLIHS